ncbi:ABC transporter substrate-binding protein [Paenibacillus cucumis (ex Kampfer et al. 2016)]|uniref:ABC transporter substrate-binding protein n=1 Tax=Paenibacillus cucumis (ex Kampfer et al. 2016) TaxID=1776858 RepID=A0ABS7KHH3_9BACL|nr:ABC transporter substrate-binding protein [Paenibacillus cucumis (ex Kampfer et al. 2016)]MBY0203411.1 ABC transporter substrate-binding protein [Paenibacillus cucumis (ex Kampfer et al. 2016)]
MKTLDVNQDKLFFSTFMFRLENLERRIERSNQIMLEVQCDKHTFLICEEGEGHLYIGQEYWPFTAGCIYPISLGEAYQLEHRNSNHLTYTVMAYDAFQVLSGLLKLYSPPLFKQRAQFNDATYESVSRVLVELFASRNYKNDAEYCNLNVGFQRWMERIITRYTTKGTDTNSESRLTRTIQYIDECYRDEITVHKLANMAGVRPKLYTTMFKQRTGQKPLDYINHVRIQHAKDWLRKTDEPLRDIASRVGFKDEYYFNRRFRQITGLSPRQYDRSIQQQTLVQDWLGHDVRIPANPERVIYYGDTAGDLRVLDIHLIEDEEYNAGTPINVEKTIRLKPDLIIIDSEDEHQYEQLTRIAPTLAYNSHAPLHERLTRVGDWFGRQKQAERWLSSYEERTLQMWEKINKIIHLGETASVLTYHRGARLFVMGNIGLAPLLYHPFGFRPVHKVQEALAAGRAYKEISADTVQEYAGDHLFLMLPQEPDARQATEKLIQSPEWRALTAVRQGRVYPLEELAWNSGDAQICDQLLERLPELLGSHLS